MHAGPVNDSPSVRERRLAQELPVLGGAAQLHGKDVAERLGWSASKVSRIGTGRIGFSAEDLERLLELYRVPDRQATFRRRLAPSARPKGWWDGYADTLSSRYAGLIRLEAGVEALRCYDALVPHALLQSPDNDREIILATWKRLAQAEVDRRVQVVRRRQELLDAAPQRRPQRSVVGSSSTCSPPPQRPTSPFKCCPSPAALFPSWTPGPPARPTSSTRRTRPASSSSTPRPRSTATARRSTSSAPKPPIPRIRRHHSASAPRHPMTPVASHVAPSEIGGALIRFEADESSSTHEPVCDPQRHRAPPLTPQARGCCSS